MKKPIKILVGLLVGSFISIIIVLILFIFVIKKNGITEFDKSSNLKEPPNIELKGVDRIPATAFWVENDSIGNWFNVDQVHNHKNNAIISVYDKNGDLIIKSRFMKICPIDEFKFIEDLKTEIDFYDGKNIQLKDNCYLLKS